MKATIALVLIGITSPALADNYRLGPKADGPRPNTNSTVWDARCPAGATVIAGSCPAHEGTHATLENFWHDSAKNRWTCAWSSPVKEAEVQAICVQTN